MQGTTRRAIVSACAWAALATSATAQEATRWLRDVGAADLRVSEAAERKLVAMGAKAVPFVERAMDEWDDQKGEGYNRCAALLRVIRLLGPDAAGLSSRLRQVGADSGNLGPEIYHVLAGLEPFAGDKNWHEMMHFLHHQDPERVKQGFVGYIRMYARVHCGDVTDADRMIQVLREDKSGAREAAAEALGRLRHPRTVELLHARLRQRTPAVDADQLTHNGFPVPFDDEFAFRASEVMIQLAPNDERCVIAYANRALHHPHTTVRREALNRLAAFGPMAAEATPELMRIAEGDDDALAIEALKVLGMAGKAVAPFAGRVQALTRSETKIRARLADGLIARLRAMGVEVADTVDDGPDEGLAALRKTIEALDDDATPAVRKEVLADQRSWALLVDRYRRKRHDAPDVVFELLMDLAWQQPKEQRDLVRHAVATLGGDHWSASVMSSTSHGNQKTRAIHRRTYAHLSVDPEADLAALVGLLDAKNAPVRLRAVELLSARRAEWAVGKPEHERVQTALRAATLAKAPKQSVYELSANHNTSLDGTDLTDEIQAAAKAALTPADGGSTERGGGGD
jgi:hypothetical protein